MSLAIIPVPEERECPEKSLRERIERDNARDECEPDQPCAKHA